MQTAGTGQNNRLPVGPANFPHSDIVDTEVKLSSRSSCL